MIETEGFAVEATTRWVCRQRSVSADKRGSSHAQQGQSRSAGVATVVTTPPLKVVRRLPQLELYPIRLGTYPSAPDGDYRLLERIDPPGGTTDGISVNNEIAAQPTLVLGAPSATFSPRPL